MTKDKWIWMPHPAHFICGNYCRFVLATYVGKYIVSTVGEYWPDSTIRRIHAEIHDPVWYEKNKHLLGDHFNHVYYKKFGFEELHFGRWTYETMVFKAVKNKNKEDLCCPFRIDVQKEVQTELYKNENDATKGHYKLCLKWSKK